MVGGIVGLNTTPDWGMGASDGAFEVSWLSTVGTDVVNVDESGYVSPQFPEERVSHGAQIVGRRRRREVEVSIKVVGVESGVLDHLVSVLRELG